jgi:hypothetical protein
VLSWGIGGCPFSWMRRIGARGRSEADALAVFQGNMSLVISDPFSFFIRPWTMGRKASGQTSQDGQLVVTRELAESIQDAGLTGVEFLPVTPGPHRDVDDRFRWMPVKSQMTKLDSCSVLTREGPCDKCGRAGNFAAYRRPTELWYTNYPSDAADFNYTWECFGGWQRMMPGDSRPNVGGNRLVVVSQRARALLTHLKVYRRFEPIWSRKLHEMPAAFRS